MQAFTVDFRPSRQWRLAANAAHVAGVLAVLWSVNGGLKWLWLVLLLLSMVWAQWQLGGRGVWITALRIDAHGRASIRFRSDETFQTAVLQDDSRIQRGAMWLHWRVAERSVWQFVWPDMTAASAFRRLKVWARWCRRAPSAQHNTVPPP